MRLYEQGKWREDMNIIGIDVSKAKLDCAWIKDISTGKVKNKVFPNTAKGHEDLMHWARKQSHESIELHHFIMEATGIYHEAVAYALHRAGAVVSVVNPAQMRDYAKSLGTRTKTDKKDSVVITRFGLTQSPRIWQPERKEIRTLKALISRLEAVEQDIQREANRLEKAEISRASNEVIVSIQTLSTELEKEKGRLEKLINQHINGHPQLKRDRALLESIPGVGPVISRLMLSVIRSRDFKSAPQCAAFMGLVPVQRESGSSIRGRSHISKAGNAKVRAKLYMAAVVAKQHNPDIKRQYLRLLNNGKMKMSALCAAMRKLVQICFGVLKHQKPYQPQTV